MDMDLKNAKNGEDFRNHAKKYVANMVKNNCTLHIKEGCSKSRFMYSYVDFDTLEEAEAFKPVFRKCIDCFPEQ